MPMKKTIRNLEDIADKVNTFADERNWDQFHSPKNLAMSLSIEAGEVMEHFQWLSEEQSKTLDAETLHAVGEEIADVQVYLVRLAQKLDIDIFDAVEKKMQKNEKNYPAEQCYGSAKKYTAYQKNTTS